MPNIKKHVSSIEVTSGNVTSEVLGSEKTPIILGSSKSQLYFLVFHLYFLMFTLRLPEWLIIVDNLLSLSGCQANKR